MNEQTIKRKKEKMKQKKTKEEKKRKKLFKKDILYFICYGFISGWIQKKLNAYPLNVLSLKFLRVVGEYFELNVVWFGFIVLRRINHRLLSNSKAIFVGQQLNNLTCRSEQEILYISQGY